ncbi:MAG: DUF3185 family protein [Wenzhouxiangellaceae bacterium]|nr:DUF3185 family protein [Wenzhouxiangellaceae bacterium]
MNAKKMIGLILVAAGAVLLYLAYESSQALDDQISRTVTGEFTEATILYGLLGVVSAVVGIVMLGLRK